MSGTADAKRYSSLITHHALLITHYFHHSRDTSSPELKPENGNGGGCDAGNPAGLAERDWPDKAQLLDHFARKAGQRVRQTGRDAQLFVGARLHRLALLAL